MALGTAGYMSPEQVRGEKLDCDRMEYNLNSETGKFYDVTGSATSRIQARKNLLMTQNPFYFQAKWAERLEDHYILHNGFLTDCAMPAAWWRRPLAILRSWYRSRQAPRACTRSARPRPQDRKVACARNCRPASARDEITSASSATRHGKRSK